jgi:hypothetical protein
VAAVEEVVEVTEFEGVAEEIVERVEIIEVEVEEEGEKEEVEVEVVVEVEVEVDVEAAMLERL